MELKERRLILGNLAALLAVPFLLGRQALIPTLTAEAEKNDSPPPRITPPAHSVKRG